MSYIDLEVRNTNPASRDEQIGIWIRKGVTITAPLLNTTLPFYFKWIWVTTTGDVTFENQEGNSVFIPAIPTGYLFPAVGRKILSAGTTATGINVYTSE